MNDRKSLSARLVAFAACWLCAACDGAPSGANSNGGSGPAARAGAGSISADGIEVVLDGATSGYSWGNALHVDEQFVYFLGYDAERSSGAFRVDKHLLGAPERIGSWGGLTFPRQWTSDEERVYWLDGDRVRSVDKAALEPAELLLGGEYFILGGDAEWLFATGEGCAKVALVEKSTGETRVYSPEMVEFRGGNFTLASNDTTVFCATWEFLYSIDKATGTVERLVSTTADRFGAAVWSRDRLFLINDRGGSVGFFVGSVTVGAPDVTVLLRLQLGFSPSALNADAAGEHLYWVERITHSHVYRLGTAALELTELATDRPGVGESALDATQLYWIETQQIVRLAL